MDTKKFGERVRQARERIGMTQIELAATIGKNQRSISAIESGLQNVLVKDVEALAEALRVPAVYFFADETTPDSFEQVLLAEFRALPSDSARQFALRQLSDLRAFLKEVTTDDK